MNRHLQRSIKFVKSHAIKSIGRYAFKNVKEIYYEGSREQWNQIKFEGTIMGTGYEDKTIHFGIADSPDDNSSDKNPPADGSSDKNPGIQKPASLKKQKLLCTKIYSKAYGNKPFGLDVKLKVGDGKLGYASSDNKVAVVDASGIVTIKGTGVAAIMVTAGRTANYQEASEKILVKVSPAKMSLKSVKTEAGKKLKISWKKNAKATGYELQYSTDKKFKKKKATKSLIIKKNKTTSNTLKKLTKGKKYFVRIRAYKNAVIDGKTQKLYGA